MTEHFPTPRTVRRLEPTQSATAAVYLGERQFAYGILANVSESGACIVTDNQLEPGADVQLKLSFYEQPKLIETQARVIWNRRGRTEDGGLAGLLLHGVKFMGVPAQQQTLLTELLRGGGFRPTFVPQTKPYDLQSALAGELEELGSKIDETTGGDS